MLRVTPADRRALRLPWSVLLANKRDEWLAKALGRPFKGHGMIGADADTVARGFLALDDDAFATYNLPQRWVERRQIPAAIDGRVPLRGATVLDLGCGPGTSTEVLCHFADPTWTILGYDLTERFVARAEHRALAGGFRNRAGDVIRPHFVCQSIAEPLFAHGQPLADASVDFAISGGVVGLYMRPPAVRRLAAELARIVRPGGHVALDAGPAVPARALRAIVESAGFRRVGTARSVWLDPRPKLVFRRDERADGRAVR